VGKIIVIEIYDGSSSWRFETSGDNQLVVSSDTGCVWQVADAEYSHWETGCNNAFIIIDGTAYENGMRFCCYCGKPLIEVVEVESED